MQLPVWFKVTHTAVPLQSAQHIAPQQRLNALQWPIVAEPQMKDRLKRGFWRLIKALDMFVLCLLCSFSYNKSQRHFPYTGKPSRTTQWTPPLADVPAQCVCMCVALCVSPSSALTGVKGSVPEPVGDDPSQAMPVWQGLVTAMRASAVSWAFFMSCFANLLRQQTGVNKTWHWV